MATKLTKKQETDFLTQIRDAAAKVLDIQKQATAKNTSVTTPAPAPTNFAGASFTESDAAKYGAAGRGEWLTPETSKQADEAMKYDVPMSALGDKNSSGKTNLENPQGYVEPRLTPDQSAKYIKSFGLEGILGVGAFSGMTASEANKRGMEELKKRKGIVTENTSYNFNPETLKKTQRAIDKFGFALDQAEKDPFEPKQYKQDTKNNLIEVTSKELGQLFTDPNEIYSAYQFNPQFKATIDSFIKKGGSIESIANNVSATPVVTQDQPQNVQDPATYLANLRNPNANQEAEKMAIDEMAPESQIAQDEIARQSKIPDDLKTLYFGNEKAIGILQMKQEQAKEEKRIIEEREKDEKKTARDRAQYQIEKNNADVKIAEAKIEENRLAAKNYMTAKLAQLGALQTTGAAVLALQTIETKYQTQVTELQTKLKFANREIEIGLNEDINKIENDTDDKVLKIQEDLTKDSETMFKEVIKAQRDAEKEIYSVTEQYARRLRERTTKYTDDLKAAAEKQAKEYAKIASGNIDFTAGGNVASKSKIVTTIENILEKSRGSDGYVNSEVYSQQLKDWIKRGGTTKSFVASFPTKLYANPNDSSLPPALQYARDSQTLPRDTSAEDEAINRWLEENAG